MSMGVTLTLRSAIAAAGLAAALLAAGCADECTNAVRFWRAKDLTSGREFYTVDTADNPIGSHGKPMFVSSEGTIVGLASYELTSISSADYTEGTKGGTWESGGQFFGGPPCWARPILPTTTH